jgi:CSLREA domain-containing protein
MPHSIWTAALMAVLCDTGPAAIRTVTSLVDGGSGSLRETIGLATSGDTIQFGITGTFTLQLGTIEFDKSLTIAGPGAPELVVLERTTVEGAPQFGIFRIEEGNSVTLSGVTFRNGSSQGGGGAVVVNESAVSIQRCAFEMNRSADFGGGALLNVRGEMSVVNCRFAGNRSNELGGAIFNSAREGGVEDGFARLDVYDSTFVDNRAGDGGAIAGDLYDLGPYEDGDGDSIILISGCTFSQNSAGGTGGALRTSGASATAIRYCTFVQNTSGTMGGAIQSWNGLLMENCILEGNRTLDTLPGYGGALFLSGPDHTLTSSLFQDNIAQRGGAIYTQRPFVAQGCAFKGNHAKIRGGAVHHGSGETTFLHNCTFSANSTQYYSTGTTVPGGGAILQTRGTLALHSCTFANNVTSFSSATILQESATDAPVTIVANTILGGPERNLLNSGAGTIISDGFNLCSDNGSGFLTGPNDQLNTNARLDPLGLRPNGGPVPTIALLATSPALDRGHSGGLTTDGRGYLRPRDLLAYPVVPGGDDSDIGAFESVEPLQASPIIVNTVVDHDDGIAGVADCSLRDAIARANALGSSVEIRFDPGLGPVVGLDPTLGPLIITSPVTISGPGARILAISGNNSGRIFDCRSTVTSTITGLTLRDGAGNFLPAPGQSASGGGLVNSGKLTVADCCFVNNVAVGADATGTGNSGGAASGGGIYNSGSLTLRGCTFHGCFAEGGEGTDISGLFTAGGNGGDASGGAIYNGPGHSLTVENCTYSSNRAVGGSGGNGHFGGNGGYGHGAAIFNAGNLTVTSVTIVGNIGFSGFAGLGSLPANNGVRRGGSGGIASFPPAAGTVRNTICAANTTTSGVPSDVSGDFNSDGYNLIGSSEGGTGFTHATDQTGTAAALLFPNVGPLQNNGGPCDTMVPTPANTGIDKGFRFSLTTDQRGLPRPLDAPGFPNASAGDGSDIGAVEADIAQQGPAFVVNTLDDHDDGSPSHLDCTLRESINAANAIAGPNTITFQPGLTGVIPLVPALGTLPVVDSLTIQGPGARKLEVRGNGRRVIAFYSGTITVSGVSIRGGAVNTFENEPLLGGGLVNYSTLTLSDCTISQNTVTGGAGIPALFGNAAVPGAVGAGGGIANLGTGSSLRLIRCTFSGNTATGGGGGHGGNFGAGSRGGDGMGGAVFNDSGCTLTVENCTFHSNRAAGGSGGTAQFGTGGDGGHGQGAAIWNLGTMSVSSATITANLWSGGAGGAASAPGLPGSGAGALFSAAGSVSMVRNTISSSNAGDAFMADVAGSFTSGGYNLIADPTGATGFAAAGDQSFADPRLGPLQNNGGPTDTCALLTGSQALDRGRGDGLAHDQRLQGRPWNDPSLADSSGGDGSDIGAVEFRPPHTGPPEFILIETIPAGLHLRVQGVPFTSYQLLRGSEPEFGVLTNQGVPALSDALGLVDFTDSSPLPVRAFYSAMESP